PGICESAPARCATDTTATKDSGLIDILPGLKLSVVTLVLSAMDWFVAGLVLWTLVPGSVSINPLSFVAVVSVAHLAGALSQIPGGLGVFDLAVTVGLGGALAKSDLAAAM